MKMLRMPFHSEGGRVLRREDAQIEAWLLGRLTEEEAAQVGARMFEDDLYFARASAREEEMIRDWAAGGLEGETRADFERKYLSSPALREKLAFSAAMTTLARNQNIAAQANRRPVFWRFAGAGCAAAVLTGLAALWHWAANTESSMRTVASRISSLEAANRNEVSYSFALSPEVERDTGSAMQTLEIPAGARSVRLELTPRPSSTSEGFRVSLKRVGGPEIWSGFVFPAAGDAFVSVDVPAGLLSIGDYILTMDERARDAAHESYVFRVGM